MSKNEGFVQKVDLPRRWRQVCKVPTQIEDAINYVSARLAKTTRRGIKCNTCIPLRRGVNMKPLIGAKRLGFFLYLHN